MKRKTPAKQDKGNGKNLPPRKKAFSNAFFLLLSCIFMVPLVFLLFAPCLQNGFSNWDDPTYIENNPLIKEFTAANVKRIFTEIYFSNYQPLHIFSYLVEYQFFKLNAWGYHLVSMLMHAGVTVMVMWLALLLFERRFIALVTGILFAVHPMHVESVAWAAERKDLLYSFFFFASLVAYLYYLKNTANKLNYLVCFLLFVLSIFSKAMAASLPPVLILIDFYRQRKFTGRVLLEKLPFFILAFILGAISVYASGRDNSINDSRVYTFFDRIILAHANLLLYQFKLLAPLNLCSYYPYPEKVNGMLPWFYFLAPVGVAVLLLAVFYSLRKNRTVFFCFSFFVITVFLVLQLLPVGPNVFAERYSYIPSAAFFMFLGWALHGFITRNKQKKSMVYLVYISLACYGTALGMLTPERCKIWKDPDTFWSDVIKKFDNVPIAYNNRGHFYNKSGRKQEALADFNKALSLNENYDMAHFNRGSLMGEMGRFPEALADLNAAIALNRNLPEAYKMRGQAFAVTGKPDSAMYDFKRALELQPDFAEVYFNMGIFYFNAGRREEACVNFKKAYELRFEKAREMVEKYCL